MNDQTKLQKLTQLYLDFYRENHAYGPDCIREIRRVYGDAMARRVQNEAMRRAIAEAIEKSRAQVSL